MNKRDKRFNQLIEETLKGIFWILVILALLGFLSSCVDNAPEPITEYIFNIEKDCHSCRMSYQVNDENIKLLNSKVAYRSATDTVYAGDTLRIGVYNIATGTNNNILYPVEGLLTISSIDTLYEINLGGANYKRIEHILK